MPSTLDDYELLCTIGSGSYGTCKKIKRKKDGRTLVWKELDYGTMSETEKQMLVSEVNLLRELKHDHIVRYYDRIIDRTNTTLYIIMEFCEGGDLATHITKMKKDSKHFEEEFVWKICVQVISALKECHSRTKNGKAVLHRDLKPANVFLDSSNSVKLGDFGLARELNHETSFAKTFVGTPYYMSPEQMNYMSYNEKSDIWSLGCLLYELCSLRPPFTARNQRELATRICTGLFPRIPLRYTDEMNTMISYMLQVDEAKRPTINHLMAHPLVLKHTPAEKPSLKRHPSSCSDEGYSGKSDSLKKREESLRERERELKRKEKELEGRERTLVLREKLAEERLARAEKLMKEYELKSSNISTTPVAKDIMPSSSDCSSVLSDLQLEAGELHPLASCFAKKLRIVESPKKKVSFVPPDKENRDNSPLTMGRSPSALYEAEHMLQMEHFRHVLDFRARMKRAEERSGELRRNEFPSKYTVGQNLLGLR